MRRSLLALGIVSVLSVPVAAGAGGPTSVADSGFNAAMSEEDVVEVTLDFAPDLFNEEEMSTAQLHGRFYDPVNDQWCEIGPGGGVDTPGEWDNVAGTLSLWSVSNDWFCVNEVGEASPLVNFTATWTYSTTSAGMYTDSKQGTSCKGEEFTDVSPVMTFVATVDAVLVLSTAPTDGFYTERIGDCRLGPNFVEPPPPTLLEITESTVLDSDHYGSINISGPGVTLNCNGHTIFGPGALEPGSGDSLGGISGVEEGVTVKNCMATGYEGSPFGAHVGYSTWIGNVAYDNGGGFGFRGDGHVIQGNTSINSEGNAFLLQVGSNSLLRGNRAEGSQAAFSMELVDNIELIGNTAIGNGEGVGFEIAGSDNISLTGNTASGYDVGFVVSPAEDFDTGLPVDSDYAVLVGNEAAGNNFTGYFVLVGQNHVFEQNLASRNGGPGFFVFDELSEQGFEPPENAYFARNDSHRNGGSGFLIIGATGTTVEKNTANRNGFAGFTAVVNDGMDTTFTGNTACKNTEFDAVDFSDPFASWTDNNFCAPDGSIPPQ